MKTKYYTVVKKSSGDLSHYYGGEAELSIFKNKKEAKEELNCHEDKENYKIMKVLLSNI